MIDVVCDLDGVLWRGDTPVPGVREALTRLKDGGARVLYVTNNASRTPTAVAKKIEKLCQVPCEGSDVLTSAMAATLMLDKEDDPVMVVGHEGIVEEVLAAGFTIVEKPDLAHSVVVGMARDFDYGVLVRASDSVRGGARFIATNVDPTYPIAGGLLPGAGSLVAAIATASGRSPEVAGKPHLPMRELIRSRIEGPLWVIGDRLDSDIAMSAAEPSWRSILVLTGVTGPDEDTSASDHVVADISDAADLILAAHGSTNRPFPPR